MDALGRPSSHQGHNLLPTRQEGKQEEDSFNEETFGDQKGGERDWSEQPSTVGGFPPSGRENPANDVTGEKATGENPQSSKLQSLWQSETLEQTKRQDDLLSSSPFSLSSVWKSPEQAGPASLKELLQPGSSSPSEFDNSRSSSPKVISVSDLEMSDPPVNPTTTPRGFPPGLPPMMQPQQPGTPPTFQQHPVAMVPNYYRPPYPMMPHGGGARRGPHFSGQGFPPTFQAHLPNERAGRPHAHHGPHMQGHTHISGPRPPFVNPHFFRPPPPQHGYQRQHFRDDPQEGWGRNIPRQHYHDDQTPPPWSWDRFMTARERDRVKEIQLSQLHCTDPFREDYYYQKFVMKSKARGSSALSSGPNHPEGEGEGVGEVEESFTKLLIPEYSREDREEYKPVEFEGTLGKLTKSSVNTPRQALSVGRADEPGDRDVDSELNSQQKRRLLFMNIERMFSMVLEVEEIDYKLPFFKQADRASATEKRKSLVEQLFKMFSVKPVTKSWRKSDDLFFLQLMFIRKGKSLAKRILPLLSQGQCVLVLSAILRNMTALIRRDRISPALPPLLGPLLRTIGTLTLSDVTTLLVTLARGPSQVNPPRSAVVMAGSDPFGGGLLCGLVSRGRELCSDENASELDEIEVMEWSGLHSDVTEKLSLFDAELDLSTKSWMS